MKPIKTITIIQILALLKRYLQVECSRATLYHYMKTKGFPQNTGLGKPRRWREDKVHQWIAAQIKKSERQ